MQDPEKYQQAALEFVVSVLGACMGFLNSKKAKDAKIKQLLAGICGGLIVVIVLYYVPTKPLWGFFICIAVSAFSSTYWDAIGDIIMRLFTAFMDGFINKLFPNKPKKDDSV